MFEWDKEIEKIEKEIRIYNKSEIKEIKELRIDEIFCDRILGHTDKIDLCPSEKWNHDNNYIGKFDGVDVFKLESSDAYEWEIEVNERDYICRECYREMMFDEVLDAYYCPFCNPNYEDMSIKNKIRILLDKAKTFIPS
jgi:uncharacterized CHY-type Zn-finger protein